jgi:hypothetical protein
MPGHLCAVFFMITPLIIAIALLSRERFDIIIFSYDELFSCRHVDYYYFAFRHIISLIRHWLIFDAMIDFIFIFSDFLDTAIAAGGSIRHFHFFTSHCHIFFDFRRQFSLIFGFSSRH